MRGMADSIRKGSRLGKCLCHLLSTIYYVYVGIVVWQGTLGNHYSSLYSILNLRNPTTKVEKCLGTRECTSFGYRRKRTVVTGDELTSRLEDFHSINFLVECSHSLIRRYLTPNPMKTIVYSFDIQKSVCKSNVVNIGQRVGRLKSQL